MLRQVQPRGYYSEDGGGGNLRQAPFYKDTDYYVLYKTVPVRGSCCQPVGCVIRDVVCPVITVLSVYVVNLVPGRQVSVSIIWKNVEVD